MAGRLRTTPHSTAGLPLGFARRDSITGSSYSWRLSFTGYQRQAVVGIVAAHFVLATRQYEVAGRSCLELVPVRALWEQLFKVVWSFSAEVQGLSVEVENGPVLPESGKPHQARQIRVLNSWHLQDAIL